jgi:pimeloyl-ACP methyl ester carboxylesterase
LNRFWRKRFWIVAAVLVLPLLLFQDRQGESGPAYQAEWLEAGDVHVRVLRTGSGDTTVFLLHGYGESLLAFRGVIPALAARYAVVAMDLPGSGLSENPGSSYSLDAMVGRVERALDQWIRGPVVVVGHSMGGEIAAALAIRRPDRIIKAVLIAPAGYGLGFGLTDAPFSTQQKSLAAWSLKARELLVPVEDQGWIADPPELPKEARADSADRAAAAGFLRDFDFAALRGRFPDLSQPTLLIWGGLDPLIPLEVGRLIAAELPNERFYEIGNSWHRPHVEQPERVVQEMIDFIGSVPEVP